MPLIHFARPAYEGDSRGARIDRSEVRSFESGDALLVRCAPWIASQIAQVIGSRGVEQEITEPTTKADFNHGYRFDRRVPEDVLELVNVLTNVLSISPPENVDTAIALDWYTHPGSDDELEKTEKGTWINHTKHAIQPTWGNSVRQRARMIEALSSFFRAHSLYAEATAIVAAPGHLADGDSFGENLAREIAVRLEIPYVESSAPRARAEQKEHDGPRTDLTNEFTVNGRLMGTVVVLDDVYKTGASVSGEAAAARRAGADKVRSLVVARTIRK